MKNILFLLILVSTLVYPYRAMSVNTDVSRQSLAIAEWAEMSPQEYAEAMGIKLKFKDRIMHRVLTRKARKAIKKGQLTGQEMAPRGYSPGWGIGFFLGIFTMAIGFAAFGVWGLLGGLFGIGLSVVVEKTNPDKWKAIEGSIWGVVFGLVTVGVIVGFLYIALISTWPW